MRPDWSQWTVEEVGMWIEESVNYGFKTDDDLTSQAAVRKKYADLFVSERISGYVLDMITFDMLQKDLKITNLVHALTIFGAIRQLVAKNSSCNAFLPDKALDPHTVDSNWRSVVMKYYGQRRPRCMITGIIEDHDDDKNKRQKKIVIDTTDLCPSFTSECEYHANVDDHRANGKNGIMLLSRIASAFTRLKLTFEYDPFRQKIILCIIDHNLLNKRLYHGGPTFATIQHTTSMTDYLPAEIWPSRKALNLHANSAWSRVNETDRGRFKSRFKSKDECGFGRCEFYDNDNSNENKLNWAFVSQLKLGKSGELLHSMPFPR